MSKWDIHGDRDFDGDVDLTDRLIEDEEFEDLMEAEAKRGIVDDLFDDEDEDDDLLLDEPVEFDSQPVTTEIVIPLSISVGVDISDDESPIKPATPKKMSKDRIPADFIIRNKAKEEE